MLFRDRLVASGVPLGSAAEVPVTLFRDTLRPEVTHTAEGCPLLCRRYGHQVTSVTVPFAAMPSQVCERCPSRGWPKAVSAWRERAESMATLRSRLRATERTTSAHSADQRLLVLGGVARAALRVPSSSELGIEVTMAVEALVADALAVLAAAAAGYVTPPGEPVAVAVHSWPAAKGVPLSSGTLAALVADQCDAYARDRPTLAVIPESLVPPTRSPLRRRDRFGRRCVEVLEPVGDVEDLDALRDVFIGVWDPAEDRARYGIECLRTARMLM